MNVKEILELIKKIKSPYSIYIILAFVAFVLLVIFAVFNQNGASAPTEIIHIINPGDKAGNQAQMNQGLNPNDPNNGFAADGTPGPTIMKYQVPPQLIAELGIEIIPIVLGAVKVTGVMGNSPADRIGISRNDIIVSF